MAVTPHRKAEQVGSNQQALIGEIANGLKELAENSQKNNKMVIKEEKNQE